MKESRNCRKCGNHIPFRVTVNGVCSNLQNRKFCLTCSPYRGHNTKKDIDHVARNNRLYEKWTENEKKSSKYSLYKRGIKRKVELVKIKGGKCQLCGYSRCLRALVFHHRDRSTKLFNLAINSLWSRPWDIILQESQKCDLLCNRCHSEVEEKLDSDKEYNAITFLFWPIDKTDLTC